MVVLKTQYRRDEMSTTIVTGSGEKVKRQDTYRLNPDDVIPGRNSRGPKAKDYEQQVIQRAWEIAEYGQKEPAVGHRDEQDRVVLDGGFKRRDAVKLLREGFTGPDGKVYQDAAATLWVTIDPTVKNEKDAFIASVMENAHSPLTDVQEAYAQGVLRDEYGFVNAEIARLYGYTNQNRVDKLEKLLAMPDTVVDRVHEGNLAMSTAVDLLFPLDPEVRETVIASSTDDTGKVQTSRVREYVRGLANGENPPEQVEETATPATTRGKKAAATTAPATHSLKRTVKEINTFIDGYRKLEDGNASAQEFLGTLQRWINGELTTDRQLLKALDAM